MGNAESGPREGYISPSSTYEPQFDNAYRQNVDPTDDWDDRVGHQVDWDDHGDWERENSGDYVNHHRATDDLYEKRVNTQSESSDDDDDDDDDYDERDDGIIHVVDDHLTEIEGAMSMMEASAAVFHYLSQADGDMEDMSIGDRSAAVFEYLEEESVKGGNEVLIEFLETASVVSAVILEDQHSVSDASAAVFDYLDKAKSKDDASVSQRSAAIFHLLDDAHTVDASISEKSAAVFGMLEKTKDLDAKSISDFSSAVFKVLDDAKSQDGRSVSDQSAAIFDFLDDALQASKRKSNGQRRRLGSPTINVNTYAKSGEEEPLSPKSQALTARIRNLQPIDENRETEASKPSAPQYSKTENYMREDYPEVVIEKSKEEGGEEQSPFDASQEVEDIDLDFVAHFDAAFNDFIGKNPRFLMKSPDLVHNFRITKLQKLLQYMENRERHLLTKFTRLTIDKKDMEKQYEMKLREAAQKKAARQIHLQGDLNKLSLSTKRLEAISTWKFITSSELRAKRSYRLNQQYENKDIGRTRREVIKNIPDGPEGNDLSEAIYAPPRSRDGSLTLQQEEDMQQLQVSNAFMASEAAVLKKKLQMDRISAKKANWIESVLLRVDELTMERLKKKFMNKVGVSQL